MIPFNLSCVLPKGGASSRYIYNKRLGNNNYFFMYIKELDEVHIRVNKSAIAVFKCYGSFSSQEEFKEYHKGFFESEERTNEFLIEVENKLLI